MSKEIPLTQGKVAIVDDADFDWLNQWKWRYLKPSYSNGTGYAVRLRQENGKATCIYMHRLIMDVPTGVYVDHINHDGLNNCRCNLRIATPSENHYNSRPRKQGTSKYKGVSYDGVKKRWAVYIHVTKTRKFLGYFDSELEAATAYNQAAVELHGEFALLNNLDNHQESNMEVVPKRSPSSSCKGVYFDIRQRRWVAGIQIDKKRVYLGSFATEQEAIEAKQRYLG